MIAATPSAELGADDLMLLRTRSGPYLPVTDTGPAGSQSVIRMGLNAADRLQRAVSGLGPFARGAYAGIRQPNGRYAREETHRADSVHVCMCRSRSGQPAAANE